MITVYLRLHKYAIVLATAQRNRQVAEGKSPILICIIAQFVVATKCILDDDTGGDGRGAGVNKEKTRSYLGGLE